MVEFWGTVNCCILIVCWVCCFGSFDRWKEKVDADGASCCYNCMLIRATCVCSVASKQFWLWSWCHGVHWSLRYWHMNCWNWSCWHCCCWIRGWYWDCWNLSCWCWGCWCCCCLNWSCWLDMKPILQQWRDPRKWKWSPWNRRNYLTLRRVCWSRRGSRRSGWLRRSSSRWRRSVWNY